jgi:EpsI family protein
MFIGIWGCVAGLAVTLYGWRTRFLVFSLMVLFFIVPLPPFVNQILTFKLKMAASKLSVLMLRAFGVSVLLEGNIIDIGTDKLQVVDACSGLRYLMPMILLTILIGYFFIKGRWRWAVLLLMILPLSIFINGLRIWISGMLIVNGHPELARNLFHDFSGWLMFMIAGIVLVFVAFTLRKIGGVTHSAKSRENRARSNIGIKDYDSRIKGQGSEVRDQKSEVRIHTFHDLAKTDDSTIRPINHLTKTNKNNANHGWLKPTLITVILCFLFAGSGWALKQIPSANNLPERTNFEFFPLQIGEWKGKRSYLSEEILNFLWSDDYVTATYYKENSHNLIYLLIPFYDYQVTNHTAHAPQTCLLGGGFAMVKSNERQIHISPDKSITIKSMILEKGDTRLLGSYFFFQRGRVITNPWMNKFYLMWDAFTKRRTDGALVRVEMTVAPEQSLDDVYEVLEEFIRQLWPILPDYIPT